MIKAIELKPDKDKFYVVGESNVHISLSRTGSIKVLGFHQPQYFPIDVINTYIPVSGNRTIPMMFFDREYDKEKALMEFLRSEKNDIKQEINRYQEYIKQKQERLNYIKELESEYQFRHSKLL
jgi:F0F1-type ATP synthase alpha subunit